VENFLSIKVAGNFFVALLFVVMLHVPVVAEQLGAGSNPGGGASVPEEYISIVNSYKYEPGAGKGNSNNGQAVCGTRCNALSADYRNYLEPKGWRLKKIASNQALVVDLNIPSLKGKCTCYADKYEVIINDLYMAK